MHMAPLILFKLYDDKECLELSSVMSGSYVLVFYTFILIHCKNCFNIIILPLKEHSYSTLYNVVK
jgi:hypothetical protein